jgi:apolipoprotein N-acyltransferase
LRTLAVQPNVAQLKKWPAEFASEIYARLDERMDFALMFQGALDLILWPETAVPAYLPDDAEADAFIRGLAQEGGVPILLGAMELAREAQDAAPGTLRLRSGQAQNEEPRLYNSAFLYDGHGEVAGVYRKIHLVPFGEYLPFVRRFPWLKRIEPLGFSCDAGTESTVLRVPNAAREKDTGRADAVRFGVLICFEDVFAGLARRAVRNGAEVLINLTNDAWFDGSAGPVQHMAHCVFRCVENRVPAVRASNSGVTCLIDTTGRIDQTTRDALRDRSWSSMAYRTWSVAVPPRGRAETFYSRYGDLPLALPCGIASALVAGLILWWERKASRQDERSIKQVKHE